jgi:hypothetical protein
VKQKQTLVILVLAVAAVFSPTAPAQSANSVPNDGHWIIKIKPPASPASQQPAAPTPKVETDQPVMLDTVKTGDIKQVTVYFRTQPSMVFNQKSDTIFVPTAKGDLMVHDSDHPISTGDAGATTPLDPDAGFDGPYPFYSRGFVFADFLRNKGGSSFKNVVLYANVRCFHYQSGDYEAWIDVASMLPVATKHQGIEADFQFLAAPTSPLQLPPDEAASLQKTEQAYRALNSVR